MASLFLPCGGGVEALLAAEVGQQVEGRIGQLFGRNAQCALAEVLAQRPLVEDEADVEGRGERGLDLLDLARAEAVADEGCVVDRRGLCQAAVADGIGDDLGDLMAGVAQGFKGCRHRLVDDLEIAAAGQFLEFHQSEVRLDPGGVAIHHQADGAGGRDYGGLGVAIAVLLTQGQRLIPGGFGKGNKGLVGTVRVIQGHRIDVDIHIAAAAAMRGRAVVADNSQHVIAVGRKGFASRVDAGIE